MKINKKVVLASASIRRKGILEQIGVKDFEIIHPCVDESVIKNEKPNDYALRISVMKAKSVFEKNKCIVIAGDTVVSIGRRILLKPNDKQEAKKYLEMLSGRRHCVYGGVCIISSNGIYKRVIKTVVKFRCLNDDDIKKYLTYDEWKGKAGGYAIQGRAAQFISFISGSYSNVVGMDAFSVANKLKFENVL